MGFVKHNQNCNFGTLNEFSGIEKDCSSYYDLCKFYFVANTIENNNVKRALFISVVGDTTHQLIRGLLSPTKLTEVDFSDIIKTLTSHYNPTKNAIIERFKFHICNLKTSKICD